MTVEEKVEIRKGLKDVYFDKTESSFIDGTAGKLLYRGYNIHDLAEHSTFEETSYLLLYGSLPTRAQLDEFDALLRGSRAISNEIEKIIGLTKDSHPMDVLRTAVSAIVSQNGTAGDSTPEASLDRGVGIIGKVATIVAAHDRIRRGKVHIQPNQNFGHAANFLYMLSGETPDPKDAALVDKDFVLHAEHGVNASTLAVRVAASTGADIYASITAGLAALKGPKHGGAAEGAMKMSQSIGSEENVGEWVESTLNNGGRLPGFGHPVYKALDPRSLHLKEAARDLSKRRGQPKWFSIIQALTETKRMKSRARLGVHPNVDLWAGAIYSLLGIPDDLFVPLFAIGRTPGWVAHFLEQMAHKDILRPRLLYDGPHDLEYSQIGDRT